jgi:hypothetical protein
MLISPKRVRIAEMMAAASSIGVLRRYLCINADLNSNDHEDSSLVPLRCIVNQLEYLVTILLFQP